MSTCSILWLYVCPTVGVLTSFPTENNLVEEEDRLSLTDPIMRSNAVYRCRDGRKAFNGV